VTREELPTLRSLVLFWEYFPSYTINTQGDLFRVFFILENVYILDNVFLIEEAHNKHSSQREVSIGTFYNFQIFLSSLLLIEHSSCLLPFGSIPFNSPSIHFQ